MEPRYSPNAKDISHEYADLILRSLKLTGGELPRVFAQGDTAGIRLPTAEFDLQRLHATLPDNLRRLVRAATLDDHPGPEVYQELYFTGASARANLRQLILWIDTEIFMARPAPPKKELPSSAVITTAEPKLRIPPAWITRLDPRLLEYGQLPPHLSRWHEATSQVGLHIPTPIEMDDAYCTKLRERAPAGLVVCLCGHLRNDSIQRYWQITANFSSVEEKEVAIDALVTFANIYADKLLIKLGWGQKA